MNIITNIYKNITLYNVIDNVIICKKDIFFLFKNSTLIYLETL